MSLYFPSTQYACLILTTESQLVRGLAAPNTRVELPCQVDSVTCGEVYYITWTKQVASSGVNDAPSWARVYLYTGANDSAPHKPIGDLLNRATFTMPTTSGGGGGDSLLVTSPLVSAGGAIQSHAPVAKLVIEEPRLQDEALYKCDVTYVKGKCPSISLVRLQMMALPGRAEIYPLGELASGGGPGGEPTAPGQVIGPLNELDQLQLACLIRGGRPAPKAAFWRKIDPTGRTINLPGASQQTTMVGEGGADTATNNNNNNNNNNKLRQLPADTQPTSSASAKLAELKVTLNHTLTSDDLGAKFECHVEHEALDAMRPVARVVSASSLGKLAPPGPDAMLDLHPAASSSINRHDGESSMDEEGGESTALGLPSLDSHVIVDLNVGVSSLDLFLIKHTGGSQHAHQQEQQQPASQRNASEPLHEGDLIELECVAYNSKPAANITWLNGPDAIGTDEQTGGVTTARSVRRPPVMQTEQRILRQRRLLQRSQVQLNSDGQTYNTHSFLSIKLSRHEHRAQISCQAENGVRSTSKQQKLVKSIELHVQHAPIVLMEPAAGIVVNEFAATSPVIGGDTNQLLESQQQQQQQPQHVQIYCIYSGNPLQLVANSVRWFKDGQPVNVHRSQGRLVESLTPSTGYPVLTIKQPNRADAGRYDCQLANSVGTSERLPASEACKLEVNFQPSVQLRLLKEAIGVDPPSSQVDLDLERELVLPGDEFVLACQVLEAQPGKITSYHWFARSLSHSTNHVNSNQSQWPRPLTLTRPLAVTEGPKYKLPPMRANFTPTSYACVASNAIGQGEPSEPIDLQLSHTPGPSRVRSVADALLRKIIHNSGGKVPAAHPASAGGAVIDQNAAAGPPPTWSQEENIDMEKPMSAGRELLLECLTQDLGRPRANIWLWFKDGQTIGSSPQHQQEEQPDKLQQDEVERIDSTASSNNNLESKSDSILKDNPISDRLHDLSPKNSPGRLSPPPPPPQVFGNDNIEQRHQQRAATLGHRQHSSPRLLGSGRYLFIPSIQLAHRGNYSCVAVNRLGTGNSFAPTTTHSDQLKHGRESYQLKVALAPSFIQPLPTRTYWAENTASSLTQTYDDVANSSQSNSNSNEQLELVCRVQCEPICHIEWLRNNEPIDVLKRNDSSENNNGHASSSISSTNYVSYYARHTIMVENEAANMFRSIESKLVLSFHGVGGEQKMDTSSHGKRVLIDRDKLLERRHFLNNSNFTCRSSANSMGGPVKSTTIFSVRYPPENVLISVPSDKLNLVEGSNGPLLSCEASGEPQIQYRWQLLRSSNNIITSSDLVAARHNTRHYGSSSFVSGQAQSGMADIHKQNAADDGGQRPRTPRAGGQHNDVASAALQQLLTAETVDNAPAAQRYVELTGLSSGEQVGSGATMISTLDLSNISIDRKQAGHYICEASNALGQTRQSVYVNVLYKPTCTTLHMHSLDSTSLMAHEIASSQQNRGNPTEDSEVAPSTKPYGASAQDEYALVRETSGDFIDLRRNLVMSPMLNRLTSGGGSSADQQQEGERVTFSGSIFGAILDSSKPRGAKLSLNDGAALHHAGDDLSNSISSESLETDGGGGGGGDDSWVKFNSILLKFLNNYSRQIRHAEDRRERVAMSASRRHQPSRRSSSSSSSSSARTNIGAPDESTKANAVTDSGEGSQDQLAPPGGSRQQTSHLLTFACMAQEGNPMQNLTFDWYFNAMKLPQATDQAGTSADYNNVNSNYLQAGSNDEQRPLVIYDNKNTTLAVIMTRRLDTKTILNPFQMSLLTIKVISSRPDVNSDNAHSNSGSARELASSNATSEPLMRAPVIKSRYQSLYTPKAGELQLTRQQRNSNNNIQFGQELQGNGDEIDLDGFNWQHRLSSLLSCSVANSIGPSEPSYVRVNVAERLSKSGAADASNSLYEFAKWRMPSLAQKSLLIISLLIGCSLIVFATFALLIGPHLRALHFLHKQRRECAGGRVASSGGSSKTDETGTNTGQSTSSQKSSVLGLLGNGGDSNFPSSSSDDDTSARLNHQLDSSLIIANGHMGMAHPPHRNTNLGLQHRGMLELLDESQRHVGQQHKSIDDSNNYDQPRNITTSHQARLVYLPDGTNLDMSGSNSTYANYHYHQGNMSTMNNNKQLIGVRNDKSSSSSSTSSKILASLRLKPFSRAKIQDRLSGGLPSITGRLTTTGPPHNRDLSNTETATTGVSFDGVESDANFNGAGIRSLSNQHTNFGNMPAGLRHSYAGSRAALASHYARGPLIQRDYTTDEATSNRLMQINSQARVDLRVNSATLMAGQRRPPLNAMDEFMRARGLDTTTAGFGELDDDDTLQATTYGSQSIRNQSSTMYSHGNDLASQCNVMMSTSKRTKPPVFPRSNTHQSYAAPTTTPYQSMTGIRRPAPAPVAARTLQQQQLYQQGQSANNFSVPQGPGVYHLGRAPYSESLIVQQQRTMMNPFENQNAFADYNQHIAYANTLDIRNPYSNQGLYEDSQMTIGDELTSYNNRSAEHIYDVNAYATPEQTPLRNPRQSGDDDNNMSSNTANQEETTKQATNKSERARVSQLIQTFDSKLSDHSAC